MTRSAARPTWARGRGEQILPGDAPQHLSFGARRDAGGEQGRRCAVDGGVAAACDLVQRAERQSPARQPAVDRLDAERKHRPRAQHPSFKVLNLLAKPQNGGWLDGSTHVLFERSS